MPITVPKLRHWKQPHRSIVALTASDFTMAQILDQAGVDVILVGDSLAMVCLGYSTTLPLTLDQMIYHVQAVCRGVTNALVVADLPFLSYQVSKEEAIRSAGRILKETEAQAVKLEGGHPSAVQTIERLVEIGIPVMGHIGVTPQSVRQMGYRAQGQTPDSAQLIYDQAHAVSQAGAFALILENIPPDLARQITQSVPIPTIGIGAGADCDGQILVTYDLLGLSDNIPPFVQPLINLRQIITDTVKAYSAKVHTRNNLGIVEN